MELKLKIFDIDDNEITSPDLDLGKLINEQKQVTHRWVVDVEEESHYEVIAEYPETGGKDVELVIDVEEQGHWETRDENDEVIIDFDGFIPDDMPRDQILNDIWDFERYILYTVDELAEIAKQKEEAEAIAQKKAEQEAFLEEAPTRVSDNEEALAELGVMAASNEVTIDDIMQAVAELGAIVAGE